MFRTLARLLNDPTLTDQTAQLSEQVFLIHPLLLSRWLDQAWSFGGNVSWLNEPNKPVFLGDSQIVQSLQLPNIPEPLLNGDLRSGISQIKDDYKPPIDPNTFHTPPAAGENL